jgi:hypothetical protein
MWRRRRDGNHSPQKNNSIQGSEGNEENGYPVPDLNKTMLKVTKEPSGAHKKTLREGILEKNHWEILDMVHQNVPDALKKFQDTKNKDIKQINELWENFNKHQSEMKDTIKRETY